MAVVQSVLFSVIHLRRIRKYSKNHLLNCRYEPNTTVENAQVVLPQLPVGTACTVRTCQSLEGLEDIDRFVFSLFLFQDTRNLRR